MDLVLFRHAAAHPADPAEVERLGELTADARRRLTDRGRERFSELVASLDRADLRVDRLVYSPWRRAVETAELLRPIVRGTSEPCAELTAPPTAELLPRLAGDRVAAVGHQPWLGELVALLTGAPPDLIDWRRGGLVWLNGPCEPGGMKVRAVASRRLLVPNPD